MLGLGIAFQGLRTFGKWRREKIEEKRIEVAIDALAAAYKSKQIFEHIRAPLSRGMNIWTCPKSPANPRASEADALVYLWSGGVSNRTKTSLTMCLNYNRNSWRSSVAIRRNIFLFLHKARRDIEVACDILEWMKEPEAGVPGDRELWVQLRRDIWSGTGEGGR
jgi:hypothetical protein